MGGGLPSFPASPPQRMGPLPASKPPTLQEAFMVNLHTLLCLLFGVVSGSGLVRCFSGFGMLVDE